MSATGDDSGLGVRLRLQGMSSTPRAFALAALAAAHSEDGSFLPGDARELETQLRLPPIGNMSDSLGRLRKQGLLTRLSSGRWALTPSGEAKSNAADSVPPDKLASSLETSAGATFGDTHHVLVPPMLAPIASGAGLRAILEAGPFDSNVMLITRFPRDAEDHYQELIPLLREVVTAHGLNLLVASDRVAEETLWANVVTHMWASKCAIVLMDSADGVLNSNVLIEIGGMLMTGRRCAILRDESVPAMPSDLVGHIYKPVKLSQHAEVANAVHRYLRDDVGGPACAECPPSVT